MESGDLDAAVEAVEALDKTVFEGDTNLVRVRLKLRAESQSLRFQRVALAVDERPLGSADVVQIPRR